MIGLDSSGLSDPCIKVNLHNDSSISTVKTQTNNPAWDTTLVVEELFLYGSLESIVASPPEIILEILDQDKNVSFGFFLNFLQPESCHSYPVTRPSKAPPRLVT
jgi:hypothetical protein